MAVQMERGVPLSALCPKFLHTNSTSHTWPFSAIAELIDNAYDPDVSAKQFWIDKTVIKGQDCLTFMDNGNGLTYEAMLKMLSFGYSDKIAVNGLEPIGIYGNGFKSGSMRLGQDAIVFSKSEKASCVGMLSQSYLKEIGAEQIIVPIVSFELTGQDKIHVREEHKASLKDILSYSPFKTKAELLTEIGAVNSTCSTGTTGTRIIIWNLRKTSTGLTEFDFVKDRYDIQIPSEVYEAINDKSQPERTASSIPESEYSLRAYCSILYLKPRMQIIIRGQKVKTQLISKSLAYIAKDYYRPTFVTKRIPITFGYNTKSKDQYGIMMYHKNRLIKAYERVGCQLKANISGLGVIGVIECNFLDPTHNKQNFDNTDKYRKTITSLGIKLEEYWKEIRFKRNKEDPNSIPVEDTMKRPDQNWVQCDECLRWRKLPDGIDCSLLPEKWFCHMNPDPQFRSCVVDEEPEDSDDDRPSYRKTYKQQEREEKLKQERKRKRTEEDIANLARQNEDLRKEHEALKRKLNEKTVSPLASPRNTPRSSLRGGAARAESSSIVLSTLSQAACSPSSSSSLPKISNVCSLSTPPRIKIISAETLKRPRINGFQRSTSETPSSLEASPISSMSPVIPLDDDDDDDGNATDDDDVVILETASTPVPKKTGFDLRKVKTERQQSDPSVGMLMECSDDAAVDVSPESNAGGTSSTEMAAVGTGPSAPPPPEQASTTTQTEVPKVKEEDEEERGKQREDEIKTEVEERAVQSTAEVNGIEQGSDVDTSGCNIEQNVIKKESAGDDQAKKPLHNGVAVSCCLNNAEAVGPSSADPLQNNSSINEIQEQQDKLLELMETAAQERDDYKQQFHELTNQLHDMQMRLQELSQANIKKECAHQGSQTESAGEGQDYKNLYEQAKHKVDELSREKEVLLAAGQACAGTSQGEERISDELVLQIDSLIRELDKSNKERDALRSQVVCLEEEKAKLSSQCEELKLSLQQQRAHTEQSSSPSCRENPSRVETQPEEAGGTGDSGTASGSEMRRSLVGLRQNVGRLLTSFVPALDPDQVNYDCNVIDEILEQVLTDVESLQVNNLRERAGND
ncbi:MORC family CW-type zinc finger protein 3-like [Myripristis murdjan]|uniref:MORC family CW-type zinc finger protein 3-like n=1 Tax=Myripristis murdjan TaxID=586833 RepID=UPI00117619EA|nr:MORC family CW-type zinc finger protein 3-like [Myripristis murdjan]